jgi:hypothetical protein
VRSLGAIVVGIGLYRYDREQFPLLRYSSNDANQVVQYLATCWPKQEDAKVIRVAEEDATVEAVTEAFETLGHAGPYDLQLLFLSGHGLVDTRSAGFVLQPPAGSSGPSLLDSARLDRLLASVSAKQTILILDCCYAEGITRQMTFFGGLGESDARLFIASSREEQRTWEDERIGHGIFTAHLLDLLRTGSSNRLKSVRDQLDVDGELFPILCDQVPLYVFEHKQQRQEPVKGGVSIRPVTLPVARAARRINQRTAFGTAVRRVRQIAVGTAMTFVAFLFFAYTLAYYAEADRNGNIRLHHGTKWLAPLFRFLPTLRADTGMPSTELSDDPTTRYPVQAGEISGFWTQSSRQGYRAWYDGVHPSLNSNAAARYDVLLARGAVRPVYRLTDGSPPSEIAFAAWALLDSSDPNQLNAVLSHVLGAARTSPLLVRFSMGDMDFNILDQTQPEIASFADALRSAAVIDPDRTFTAYLGFLKANEIWLAHSSPQQHGEEAQRRAADDVADVLAVIAKERMDRGEPALDSQMTSILAELGQLGYGDLVHLAISRVATSPADRKSAAYQALSAFHGNSGEPDEAAAIRQLEDSLDSSPDSQAIVEETYKRFVAASGPEQSDLTAFLIAAADQKALPSSVIAILLKKAQEAVARHDDQFMDTEYARILAHAMDQVPLDPRPLVYRLIEKVTAAVTPLASSTAEMYTALGRQGLDTPAMFQQIIAEARNAPPYQAQNPDVVSEPLPGLAIVVDHGPWLEALAVLGSERPLPNEAIEALEKQADDPSLRDDIVRALAHQPAFLDQQCWNTSCARMLKAFPKDSAKRQLASDILAENLANLPRSEFLSALERLRTDRSNETEPEVRIALGLATINAQLARVRTIPAGSQLFQRQANVAPQQSAR